MAKTPPRFNYLELVLVMECLFMDQIQLKNKDSLSKF